MDRFSVTSATLRRWANAGLIKYITTPGGHYRYLLDRGEQAPSRRDVIYARVSSSKQKGDLARQIDYLKARHPTATVLQDTASSLNFHRPSFLRLLKMVEARSVDRILVTHRDRIARFGYELFEIICTSRGTSILTDSSLDGPEPPSELQEELLAVMHHFTGRMYAQRTGRTSLAGKARSENREKAV